MRCRGSKQISKTFDKKVEARNFLIAKSEEKRQQQLGFINIPSFEETNFQVEALKWLEYGELKFSTGHYKRVEGILENDILPLYAKFTPNRFTPTLKVKSNLASNNILLASEIKKDIEKDKFNPQEIQKLKKKYYKRLALKQGDLGKNIETIELEHKELLRSMRLAGVKIDALTELGPKLTTSLSFLLNVHVSDLSDADIINLKFTNYEWYLLKKFSNSKDFKIMLKREMLTTEFVQIENLAEIYSSKKALLANANQYRSTSEPSTQEYKD